MKRYGIILMLAAGLLLCSCEKYLDHSPDMGLTEDDIYKDYNSLRGFLDKIYQTSANNNTESDILIYMYAINSYGNLYSNVGNLSDEYVCVRNSDASKFVNAGNWLGCGEGQFEIDSRGRTAIARAYRGLRIANKVIGGIDRVPSLTEDQRNKLLGQAYFLRAYFYFELIKRYGGMPKFDKAWSATDDFDVPRMTYQESNEWMQGDLDNAIAMLPDLWPDEEFGRPDKVSALALKAMTQLYAASPLMQNGLDAIVDNGYGKEMAAEAARTAQKCIDAIDASSWYRLMDHDEYRSIYLMPNNNQFAQPEYLWFNRTHPGNWSAFVRAQWLTQPYDDKTGAEGTPYNAPSQNMVDMFERKGEGGYYYPIDDPRSGYEAVKYSDPYSDRDPRLSNNIIVPGEAWGTDLNGVQYYLTTYVGGYSTNFITTNQFTNAAQHTGYLCKKFIWPEASIPLFGAEGFNMYRLTTVYIRVSQVYLDFAEASFEATGDPDAKVDGCSMSARDALNIIRNRAGIGDLPSGVDFREAYRRERAVELMFEGHRWYDIRRWMIAEELFKDTHPMKRVLAYPLDEDGNPYPGDLTGAEACKIKIPQFRFEYTDVTTTERVFSTRNYWYPLPMEEVAALDNLKQNPGW